MKHYTWIKGVLMAVLVFCLATIAPAAAHAAPAEGATVQYTGTSGTVTWEIYTDGTMVIRPTSGDEGTMRSLNGNASGVPWYSRRSNIKRVETQGTIHLGSNAAHLFNGLSNCTEMDLSGLDTGSVTNMQGMFSGCKVLAFLNVSGFDTGSVTDMSSMFNGCSKLTSLDISGFDTGSVTDMSSMFNGCSKLTSLDVSELDTKNVTNMSSMFYNCSGLTSLDVSGFDTSNVTDMVGMFSGCSGLTSLDVSGFDTDSATNMGYMFYNCSGLTSLDVSGFDTGNVTNMRQMFYGCSSLTSLDASGLDTENVTNMSFMFYGCSRLTSLDISGLDTDNVTDMSNMFSDCSGLTSLDVSGFDTKNVTNMSNMFYYCSKLTSLDVSGFDTGNVTSMNSMFYNCSGLTSLDVSGLETGNVTNMGYMFSGCSGLTSLDVSGFDTGNVTDMSYMFRNCSSLTSLDVSGLDTGNVTSMGSMFSGCSGLTSLDVSGFDTDSVTNMNSMFSGCSKLTSLDVSGFDTGKATDMSSMFYGCSGLTSLDVSGFDTGKVTDMRYMFFNCYAIASLDIGGFDTRNATRMSNMFGNCSRLSEIILGEDFRFKGKNISSSSNCALPPTPPSATTTGKWIREDGSVDAKTPAQLRDQYDANATAWAGKWVWEEKPTSYTVKFTAPDGFAGFMPDQKIKAAEAGTLNANAFSRFDYTFDHWDGSDGRTYTDGQTIPANRFRVGDTLTLTAAFTKDQHFLNFTGGVAEFILKAGEKAVFSGLPGGTSYRVWEETPSGWQLVKQENPTGTIPANGTAEAGFYNEYVPGTATVTLMATKTIDGRLPEAGAFEFELLDGNGAVIGTASNDGTGLVTFDAITFTEPGTYVYSIREVRGEDGGISYDPHTEVITIGVEDDGQGNLIATSSSMNTLPSFENETKPGMLRLRKHAEGGSGDEVFTFEIELTNENGMPLDSVQITGEAGE